MNHPTTKTSLFTAAAAALLLLTAGCASHASGTPQATPAGPATATANANVNVNVTTDTRTALACAVPSNCVNSFDSSGLAPLRFEGTPAQAMSALRATLAEFPDAEIITAGERSLETVFTTTVGFKDLVDFRVDAQAQRIDYRSRSSFGLYDFGKNRSRMKAFSAKFEQNAKR